MFFRLAKHTFSNAMQRRSNRSLSAESDQRPVSGTGTALTSDSAAAAWHSSGGSAHTPSKMVVFAKNDHSKLGTTVRQILDNPQIAKRFKEYAASLHADEDLRFLDEMQRALDAEDQQAAAAELMKTYINDGAPFQVNLKDVLRSELIEKFTTNSFQTVSELFEDATYEIFTDIKKSDTFRNFIQLDEEAKRLSSDETFLLDMFLCSNENFRLALQCVSHEDNHEVGTETCNLVRFCASVNEFEKEDDKIAKKARGNKIAATFIQAGSTFQISLPQMYVDAIFSGRYNVLPDARIESLQILAKNDALMELIRIHFAEKGGMAGLLPSVSGRKSFAASTVSSNTSNRVQELANIFTSMQGKRLVQTMATAQTIDEKMLNKVRFCSAVASFMALQGSCDSNCDKLSQARKIVANYVQVGSSFQIDIAPGFVEDLCEKKSPNYANLLGVLYQQMISDLACDDVVSDCLSEWE